MADALRLYLAQRLTVKAVKDVKLSNDPCRPRVLLFSIRMNGVGDGDHGDFLQNANETPHFCKLMPN